MDQRPVENHRLRSVLFGDVEADPTSQTEDDIHRRVLVRRDRPVLKRTPSELGRPNGKRTLGFGR